MMEEKKLKKIIDLMERDDSVAAPTDAVKWAKSLYRSYIPETRPSVLRRIVAVLEAAITPDAPAFGERSAGPSQERQLLFTAGETGIHLTLTGSKRSAAVRGQILSNDLAAQSVRLAGDRDYSAEINEGEFIFESVAGGEYELIVKAGETEIVVEGLSV
jgi:hypothetical protein